MGVGSEGCLGEVTITFRWIDRRCKQFLRNSLEFDLLATFADATAGRKKSAFRGQLPRIFDDSP
jgi:hypothetical protein